MKNPVYEQIQAENVTTTFVACPRVFGGDATAS